MKCTKTNDILGISKTNTNSNCSIHSCEKSKTILFSGKAEYNHGYLLYYQKLYQVLFLTTILSRIGQVNQECCRKHTLLCISFSAGDSEKEQFYQKLQETIDSVPKYRYQTCRGSLWCQGGKVFNTMCHFREVRSRSTKQHWRWPKLL